MEELHYLCNENKDADHRAADLHLYFLHTCTQKAGFLMTWLVYHYPGISSHQAEKKQKMLHDVLLNK